MDRLKMGLGVDIAGAGEEGAADAAVVR